MRSFVVLVLLLPGCAGRSACFDQPWMMRSEDFRSSYLHAIERADGTLSEPAEIVWATNERSLLAYPPDGGTARVGFAVEAWFGAVEDSTCLGGLARADAPAVPAVERPVARVDFTVDLVPTTANDVLGPVEPASPLVDLAGDAPPVLSVERDEAGELVRLEASCTYVKLAELDYAIVRHVFTRHE